jgi:hypothetical protein
MRHRHVWSPAEAPVVATEAAAVEPTAAVEAAAAMTTAAVTTTAASGKRCDGECQHCRQRERRRAKSRIHDRSSSWSFVRAELRRT